MKGSILFLGFLASITSAASLTEVCSVGYCTLNGGTKGGAGGATTTASSLTALQTAVADDVARIVVVSGTITGNVAVAVGGNKSVIGLKGATLSGVGLRVLGKPNVIIRNLIITKCLVPIDNIGNQLSTNVWDYYDGLIDITHTTDYITISNTYFHDHWKGTLVGHSDNNQAEDTGHLRITYYQPHFKNVYSRGPSLRFGTGYVINGWYEDMEGAVNTCLGAQILVENTVFSGITKCIISTDVGYAVLKNSDLGGGTNSAPTSTGTLNSVPYTYSLVPLASTTAVVGANQGAILSF
ncbi:pectin lyase-like protein [Choiromyces venosus 120613-1]|uniref:Pectin lyase-like protein n=1 Tax=Choiromyces venosus 120613-1 TaxID=1336337 RepID=A0A3N4K3H7_9PEZI|nr:pectin lyase-like protein [Choiromyces venosus 120613-1]